MKQVLFIFKSRDATTDIIDVHNQMLVALHLMWKCCLAFYEVETQNIYHAQYGIHHLLEIMRIYPRTFPFSAYVEIPSPHTPSLCRHDIRNQWYHHTSQKVTLHRLFCQLSVSRHAFQRMVHVGLPLPNFLLFFFLPGCPLAGALSLGFPLSISLIWRVATSFLMICLHRSTKASSTFALRLALVS